MNDSSTSRKGAILALPLVLLALLLWAGSNSTQLPNGANLSVTLDDPGEWKVPHDAAVIDVDVAGSASVGEGDPDATIIYVMDFSGSTSNPGGGCGSILQCEKSFFVNLNDAAIADGSTDLVAVVKYETSSVIALGLTDPNSPAVNGAINSGNPAGATNCAAGLTDANTLVSSPANTNGTSIVVFASDGLCNTGGQVALAANALAAKGVILHSIAIGAASNCASNGGTGTLNQATANGGSCHPVPDPNDLPDIIRNLIGSTLESLEIDVDGGGAQTISNDDITPDLPVDGAASVTYGTTVTDLAPGDHEICVTANGSDVSENQADVTQCETAHLLQLTASPAASVNDLNLGNEHTVTAEIQGGSGPNRDVDFAVGGHNAGTASPGNAAVDASPNSPVSFTYSVPQDCASLGSDTITVSATIGGMEDSIVLSKEWIDEVAPEVSCVPGVNPAGNEPKASNEDGFFRIQFSDPTLNCPLTVEVSDGSGHVFPGPFNSGDTIKYTQAGTWKQKTMGKPEDAVRWHLIGLGDLTLTVTDSSGNVSSVTCLVPPPPK